MKFLINKNELLEVLKFCEKIIDTKFNNNPVLNNIILDINNISKCICSNGIISGQYVIDKNKITIEQPGKIYFKNKILLETISKIKEEQISFEKIENSVILIKTDSFTSEINILNEDNYPKLNFSTTNLDEIQISSEIINEIYKKNSKCVLNDFNQPKPINGIYFSTELETGYLTTLSTDTFRLSYLKSIINTEIKIDFILNNIAILVASQIFKNNELVSIFINNTDKRVFISNGKYTIMDKQILGDYPVDIFIKAFNIEKNTTFTIKKNELINSLELSKVTVNLERNPITILEIGKDSIYLNSSSYEIGTSRVKIDFDNLIGPELKIGFNISFFLTLLKNIDSEKVNIYIENNLKPILLVGENLNFQQLILPVKINN